ncbi:MAG: ABC transporter substrate-binding protein [Clostridia bacterium]|nr:ABC transporter substrate-binding protein [Clostridia bacterium]
MTHPCPRHTVSTPAHPAGGHPPVSRPFLRFVTLLLLLTLFAALTGCTAKEQAASLEELTPIGTMELRYAQCFSVTHYEGGIHAIHTDDGGRYLLLAEEAVAPDAPGYTVIRQPLSSVYLVASAAMSLIDAVDGLPAVRLSGTKEEDWTVEGAAEAMRRGDLLYAGKYSAPDFELLLKEGCDLAVQSTMIYRSPEVVEKLEELGIPVLVDRSSYESHPLGRSEWIRLYGLLLGREQEADRHFAAQEAALQEAAAQQGSGKTVAFFYVTENGTVSIRNPEDYLPEMIRLAGGRYLPEALAEAQTSSSVSLGMEDFYAAAKEADLLVYNASIDDPPRSIDELVEQNALFAHFRAVQEGNVWCADKRIFQSTADHGELIRDFAAMLQGREQDCRSLTRLAQETAP